jgi:hypothetical protein
MSAKPMSIRLQLRFRAFMSALTGIVLLLESIYAEFFRSGLDAWATMVNFFIALFGFAFFFQCWRLIQQLQEARSEAPVKQLQEARSK